MAWEVVLRRTVLVCDRPPTPPGVREHNGQRCWDEVSRIVLRRCWTRRGAEAWANYCRTAYFRSGDMVDYRNISVERAA
jgi:hypothetical protein